MPRVSKAQTDLNRIAIEKASARLFREKGLNGISVADLMAAAGLTHGGFYGHFSSKDELAAIACGRAFSQASARWITRAQQQPDAPSARKALIEAYLSPDNLHDTGNGCPAMTLAGDVAREAEHKPVRAAYLNGMSELIDILASVTFADDDVQRRQIALAQWSTMVGAMMLAHATQGSALSDEILNAAHATLLPPTLS